ncbi:hypothetical protein KHC23_18235 [Ancylobacter dichloromethanicus]|uniref:Uncharacterized protein n=1 Tax=Ancylobacter dichloromethanicus TaxID=518825 RepID=A0A9W6MXP1_9HYPH|nr:hypothetical protein [Ancylobacter dichloromethanicus]MBS7555577.1 hypothetical protein [Ancylobacter dichloromethanicus]GLK70779.1 hypothetical protein GCM10017643_08940 [Ancylobacter dichloromethanicus]
MRLSDIALIAATLGLFAAAEASNRVEMTPQVARAEPAPRRQLITCPLRKPDFATVMQAAMLGDGTILVEQQTNTRVLHIKDC